MNRTTRAGVLVAGLLVIVVAFVLLSPSDDDTGEPTRAATDTTTDQTATTDQSTTTTTKAETPEKPAKPKPEPAVLLQSGKVAELNYKPGETIRLRARSQTDDAVHVHGYDESVEAPAGKTVSLSFKADLEGVFEIEFEESAEPIATLQVSP